MGTALLFLLFTIVFAHFMDKWSRDIDEIEADEALANNLIIANFAPAGESKRAA